MELEKKKKISRNEINLFLGILLDNMEKYVDSPLYRYAKRRSVSSKDNRFIVLKDTSKAINNQVGLSTKFSTVGFLMYRIHKKCIYIYEIHVVREYQSKGYGKMLVQELLKNETYSTISLCVYKANIRAFLFYKKLGFTVSSENENTYEMVKTRTK